MRNFTLAALTVLAVILLAVGGVAAIESNDPASDHDPVPENASAAEWTSWIEQHMTEQMGADAAAQMQDQMDMSYEEMGEHMASRQNGPMMVRMMSMRSQMDGSSIGGMMNGSHAGGMMSRTGSGRGCH